MEKLDRQDLKWAIKRLPTDLKAIMLDDEWKSKVFVGGGFIRSIVSGEEINDVDIFVPSKEIGELLAYKLAETKEDVYTTKNAFTIKAKPLTLQIIHRWTFESAETIAKSFDFTVCSAVIYVDPTSGNWESYIDKRFYIDLSAKRLVYMNPERNEDAGGSMLRVLKYYRKGYRIPLDSLGDVITRLMRGVKFEEMPPTDSPDFEQRLSKVITSLLVEVDPNIDPEHLSHLPTEEEEE